MKFRNAVFFLLILLLNIPASGQSRVYDSQYLWDNYGRYKISPVNPATLRHDGLMKQIEELREDHPGVIRLRKLGESVEGRSINLITVGTGFKKILMWTQMHGNEPTATAAMLDILNFINLNMPEQYVRDILSQVTLLIIPMLNPDGAERFTRRNAQDIDVNRDARYLQSPEARILKAAKDELNPDFGFNLHDMGARNQVGRTGKTAAIALLAPPFDYEDTDNDVKIRAKRVASCFLKAVEPFAEGLVSKYDADYMPRSFGDSMQSWGVSTVLIESGGWEGIDRSELARLNFTGLLSVIHAIATDAYLESDPALYDELYRSGEHRLFDLMISNVTIVNGAGIAPYMSDLGINYSLRQTENGPEITGGSISDLGDLRVTKGKAGIDGSELVCVPGFIVYDEDIDPGRIPAGSKGRDFLKKGITTVVGRVNLGSRKEVEKLNEIHKKPGINAGFIGSIKDIPASLAAEDINDLINGLTSGILGVYMEESGGEAADYIRMLNKRTIPDSALTKFKKPENMHIGEIPAMTSEAARNLGVPDRGEIRIGAAADLLLFEKSRDFDTAGMLDFSRLRYIILSGRIVFENGRFSDDFEGNIIRR